MFAIELTEFEIDTEMLIIYMGYYWPNLRKDAQEYAQRCNKCQRYADTSHAPVIK